MQFQAKEKHHVLRFKCKNCGSCCKSTMIVLYPFDIKNICAHLTLTSTEFHQQYSVFSLDETQLERCLLRNRPDCPFRSNRQCQIYPSRPIRCRLYPLGRYFETDQITYLIAGQDCLGFESGKKQTIAEWLEQQDITKFDQLTKDWNNFLIRLKEDEQRGGKMFRVIFRKVFYDFDDQLIQKYRQQLRPETSLAEFMGNLYELFEMLTTLAPKSGPEGLD